MELNKLTIYKLGSESFRPTSEDFERWQEILEEYKNDQVFLNNVQEDCDVSIEIIYYNPKSIMNVEIKYLSPYENLLTENELEKWAEVINEARLDPDFVIYTWHGVEITIRDCD